MAKEKLVIIDAHALIHRAYHAIPPLTTKEGEVVNAVYGFTMILLNVFRDLKPKCVAVAFDLPGKTHRHVAYTEYKANRKVAPSDLVSQFARVREVVEAFNIPIYDKEGYEADDVIGAIAKKIPKDVETIIVTGDMDELQLVDEHTKVYTMRRGFTDTVLYDIPQVIERYDGLTPDLLIEYKALKGDPSDNIPGVAGIGEKTAIQLIKEYKSLENLYENLGSLKPAVAAKLAAQKEIAFLSRELSTIQTDLDVNFDLTKCVLAEYDRKKVFELFQYLEFKSLLAKIPEAQQVEPPLEKIHLKAADYQTVDNQEKLQTLILELRGQKLLAVDTETTSKNPMEAELVGISLSTEAGKAYYLPLGHLKGPNLTLADALERLQPILEDPTVKKIGHNLKYDYIVLKNHGVCLRGLEFDTMIAAYLLNPNARAQKLEELAFTELGIEMVPISEIIGAGKNQTTFDLGEISDCSQYACEDADVSLRLYHKLLPQIQKAELAELLHDIEIPLIPILAEMEMCGVLLDFAKLEETSERFGERLLELEASIWKEAGREFNIASPSQLQEVLFSKLKLDEQIQDKRELKKLKTGGYSTSASELEKLSQLHPIINHISQFRELSKLKNTYLDVLPKLVNKKTGRIHTSYNQAITQTGRLSSSDPNLQNIPIRTEAGRLIRSSFIPKEGFVLLSADYSQIELRVIAHIAGDEDMIKVFREGRDIHTETAAKVFKVTESAVTSDMRRIAKIINFGIIYGVSPHGLKQQAGVTREEGKDLIDRYFELHPKIKTYTQKTIEQAKNLGYVETIFGRRRFLPEILSSNFAVRGAAERMAINMPVQGSAADLMKLAMIDIAGALPQLSPQTQMLLQVHDELVFEVPESEVEKVTEFVKEKMDHVVELTVPIETSIGWGKNWEGSKK